MMYEQEPDNTKNGANSRSNERLTCRVIHQIHPALAVQQSLLTTVAAVNSTIQAARYCQPALRTRRLALSTGNSKFRPTTKLIPLNRSPKLLSQVITSATPIPVPTLVQIRPHGASMQIGNETYLFIPVPIFPD